MDTIYYLDKFQSAVNLLDRQRFDEQQLGLKIGVWLDSVALKIQDPNWLDQTSDVKPFSQSLFFSIWLNDATIRDRKLYYNIHALKIRELTSYKIKSREFAEAFRALFKPFEQHWPNVGTLYAPHTLMEGWVDIDPDNFATELTTLAYQFLDITPIINKLLHERKR